MVEVIGMSWLRLTWAMVADVALSHTDATLSELPCEYSLIRSEGTESESPCTIRNR